LCLAADEPEPEARSTSDRLLSAVGSPSNGSAHAAISFRDHDGMAMDGADRDPALLVDPSSGTIQVMEADNGRAKSAVMALQRRPEGSLDELGQFLA